VGAGADPDADSDSDSEFFSSSTASCFSLKTCAMLESSGTGSESLGSSFGPVGATGMGFFFFSSFFFGAGPVGSGMPAKIEPLPLAIPVGEKVSLSSAAPLAAAPLALAALAPISWLSSEISS